MSRAILLPVLAGTAFTIGADEYVLGPLLTPIGADFGVAPARVVWMVSAFALPYALLAPLFGALADRQGRRRIMLPGLLVFVAATAGTALAPSFELALLARVLTGAGAAAVLPNVFATVGDLITAEAQPRAMGRVQLGLTLGLIASPALGAWAAEWLGWRSAFWLIAGAGLLSTIALWPRLPGRPADSARPAVSWRALLATPGAAAALAAMTLGIGVAVGTYALVGEFLRERYGFGTLAVGGLMALFGLYTVLGNLLVGPATRLLGDPPRVILAGIAGVGAGLAVITLVDRLPLAGFLLAGALWLVLGGCAAPALQSYLAGIGGHQRGLLLALASSGLNLGIMLMTALEGWLYASFGREAIGLLATGAVALATGWLAAHVVTRTDSVPPS